MACLSASQLSQPVNLFPAPQNIQNPPANSQQSPSQSFQVYSLEANQHPTVQPHHSNLSHPTNPTFQVSNEQLFRLPVGDIAHSFVYQYYSKLYEDPSSLHLFYGSDSQLHRILDPAAPDTVLQAVGQKQIREVFQKCLVERTTSRISFIEAQYSIDGGVFLMVVGVLNERSLQSQKSFAQSVFLAPQKPHRRGWYIYNEIFAFYPTNNEILCEKTDNNILKEGVVIENGTQLEAPVNVDGYNAENQIKQTQGVNDDINQLKWDADNLKVEETTPKTSAEFSNEEANEEPLEIGDASLNIPCDTIASENNFDAIDTVEQDETKLTGKEVNDLTEENAQIPASGKLWKVPTKWKGAVSDAQDDNDSTPGWPKLGEVPASENQFANPSSRPAQASHKTTHAPEPEFESLPMAEQYDTSSFAYHLLHNLQPGYHLAQKKTTSKPKEEVGVSGTNLSVSSALPPQVVSNVPSQKKPLSDPNFFKKVKIVGLPDNVTDEDLRKAVSSQLRQINGHIVEILRPAIELDSRKSADVLLKQGLYLKGFRVLILPLHGKKEHEAKGGDDRKFRSFRPFYNRSQQQGEGSVPHRSEVSGQYHNATSVDGSTLHGQSGKPSDDAEGWVQVTRRRQQRNRVYFNNSGVAEDGERWSEAPRRRPQRTRPQGGFGNSGDGQHYDDGFNKPNMQKDRKFTKSNTSVQMPENLIAPDL